MLMQFNVKFFFTSVVLSFVVGIFQHLIMWLHLYRLPISVLSWISFALAPVQLGFAVFLPFGVMYIFSRRTSLVSAFQSIIVSTFLGCWTGGVAIFVVDRFISSLGGATYDSVLLYTFWIGWSIFALAFSQIFFVSLAAILWAYYQKSINKPFQQPPLAPLSKPNT